MYKQQEMHEHAEVCAHEWLDLKGEQDGWNIKWCFGGDIFFHFLHLKRANKNVFLRYLLLETSNNIKIKK